MASRFGWISLLLFLLRRLDLEAAFERVSHAMGARVIAIEMPMAEAAVDVDKLSDWELVKKIFDERLDDRGANAGAHQQPGAD